VAFAASVGGGPVSAGLATKAEPGGGWQRSSTWALLLLLTVVVVYGRVWGHGFLDYDDNLNIYENPLLKNLSLANLLRFWQRPYEGLYIPLTYSVWALVAKISALLPTSNGSLFNPQPFHAANILVHGANTIIVFLLLRTLGHQERPAVAGALLFALHPLQVEAVAWVTGFKAVLCGLFGLLTLWLYARHGRQSEAGHGGCRWSANYWGAGACFVAAMLTMPSAVVLPLVAGVIGVWAMARPWRRVASELWPWLLLVLPVVLLTKGSQPDSLQGFLPTLGQRFLVAGDALSFYLGKLLWPVNLGPDYGRTPEVVLNQGPQVFLRGLLPYLLAALLLWRCRKPRVWAGVGISVAVLAPVLGFLSFSFQDMSTVADRYCYLAMVGPALAVAGLLGRLPTGLATYGSVAVLAGLAVLSNLQTRHWQDSVTFNTYTLTVNPRSWLAFHNLGLWYLDQGQLDQAIVQYQKALALKPNSFKAYNNLGMIYDRQGEKERAIAAYQQALAIQPNYPLVCNNLAVIYKGLNRYDEAIAYYQRALALDPEFAEVYANLGNLYRQLGKPEAAADNYRRALDLRPHNADLANDLGLLYAEEGKYAEAIACYRQAVAARPRYAEAHANMGVAYKRLTQLPEAIAAFRQAIDQDPELAEAYINLGVLLAETGARDEALQMYGRAQALRPDDVIPAYALGTLYLDLGRDHEALEALQQAVAINPEFGPAYNSLSLLALRAQEFERAVEMADRAQALGYADQGQLDAVAPFRKR
jgi:tetratricopeptide (TPR) repeat protein